MLFYKYQPKLLLCTSFFQILLLSLLCIAENARACGYSYIGECSTAMHLKINGTVDSFAIADCSFGHRFDGLELGAVQSLYLVDGRAITWESCQNNVTAVLIYYRIYPEGGTGGAWSSLSLQEDYNMLDGPYTARYRSMPTNLDLAAGLTAGSDYVLEVYVEAAVDTVGEDYIPETTMAQNNGGQNYHLRFTYGGSNAPPFTVVKTLQRDIKCPGDSTGAVGVTVYGDQDGLFYHWSNINSNFYAQLNLTAGSYTVTVSGSGAYTASRTFQLPDPPPLVVQENIEICHGQFYVRGGMAFDQPGDYSVVLPGLTTCDTTLQIHLEVLAPVAGVFTLPVQAAVTCAAPNLDLCAQEIPNTSFTWYKSGASYQNGPCTTINSGGSYSVIATQTGISITCAVSRNILVEEHTTIPSLSAFGSGFLGCNAQGIVDVAFKAFTNAENPAFSWTANGQLLSTADTCLFTFNFNFPPPDFPTVQVTDAWGCQASAEPVFEVLQAGPISVETSVAPASGPAVADGSAQIGSITGGIPPYEVLWDNGMAGNIISGLLPGVYCAQVTDAVDCIYTECVTVGVVDGTVNPALNALLIRPNLLSPGGMIYLTLPEIRAEEPLSLQWMDAAGRLLYAETLRNTGSPVSLSTPADLPCGMVFLRVINRDFQAVGAFYLH